MAKGTLYRHFASEERLRSRRHRTLAPDTLIPFRIRRAVALGGPSGLDRRSPEKAAAMVFGHLLAGRAAHALVWAPGRPRATSPAPTWPAGCSDAGGGRGRPLTGGRPSPRPPSMPVLVPSDSAFATVWPGPWVSSLTAR